MPDIFLLVGVIVCGIVGVVSFICSLADSEFYWPCPVAILLGLLLGFWFACGESQPTTYLNEVEVTSYNVDGAQVILYKDKLINLNKELGKSFPPNCKFKVKQRNHWSFGLYKMENDYDYEPVMHITNS